MTVSGGYMRKGSKPHPTSYWVQLLYEQVERARSEQRGSEEPAAPSDVSD